MNPRFFFLNFTLIVLVLGATPAFADGAYQRAKDRKTIVWNNDPQPEDAAAWTGDRDADGYATGFGTLTWYRVDRKFTVGSTLPVDKQIPTSRYAGSMVRGKFEGPVVTVDHGKMYHAKFVDGRRKGLWLDGDIAMPPGAIAKSSGGTGRMPESDEEKPEPNTAAIKPSPAATEENPEAPAEGPAVDISKSTKREVSKSGSTRTTAAKGAEFDDSLRSLVGPPSSLRTGANGEASPQPSIASAPTLPTGHARLTTKDVITLADAEARAKGYELGEYQRPKVDYSATDETWSAAYALKPAKGTAEGGKRFSVTVEDKTKKTSIIPER